MAQNNAFSILGLPARFALDEAQIEENWRRAIALVHPDRFAGRSAAERRVAEQWSGRINEAREALSDPVRRAQLLIAAAGVDVGAESDTRMPADFLMQQMSWREALEDARDPKSPAFEGLCGEVDGERSRLMSVLAEAIDRDQDWPRARDAVRRLMFVEKFRRELLAVEHGAEKDI